MKKKKYSFSIPSIKIPSLARLGGIKIPLPNGLYLGGGKLLVGGFGTVVIGFVASTFILMESGTPDIAYPQPGAVYTVPSRIGEPILGYRDMGEISADRNQTLQINIPGGSRISDMVFSDVSLGKTGLANAIEVSGTSVQKIVVDDLKIINSSFPTMTISGVTRMHTITISSGVEVAGHTFTPTFSTTDVVDISVGSLRGAGDYVAKDMIVDRILIKLVGGSGDVVIDNMIFDNVNASVGKAVFENITVGEFFMKDTQIGDDGNIDSADFIIENTVKYKSMSDGTIEKPIKVQ
jgi:hypothetical protein